MKNNLLYFLLFLSFNLSSGQVIDLNLLIKENKTLTDSFQDYLTSMNFKLYQTKVNSPQKIDTIVFVNKENVEVGIVKTKKTTDIYMNQINESYFKTIQDQLHNNKFMLISSKTQMNNSILKTYISFEHQCEILLTTFGLKDKKEFEITYELKVLSFKF